MVQDVKKLAKDVNLGGFCCDKLSVQIEIRDDAVDEPMLATNMYEYGKCVIGINILSLIEGEVGFRFNHIGIEKRDKTLLVLLNAIISQVAHCVMHKRKCDCDISRCIHFYETENEIRSFLVKTGIRKNELSVPKYLAQAASFAQRLKLTSVAMGGISKTYHTPSATRHAQENQRNQREATTSESDSESEHKDNVDIRDRRTPHSSRKFSKARKYETKIS